MALEARATASSGGAIGGGDALSKKRAYKEKFQEGVALFNKKPKKGIAFMQVRLRELPT
jgi:brefeldin A-inhibited guanine nucleotide-exchange protein